MSFRWSSIFIEFGKPDELQHDKDICLAAVKRDGYALRYTR